MAQRPRFVQPVGAARLLRGEERVAFCGDDEDLARWGRRLRLRLRRFAFAAKLALFNAEARASCFLRVYARRKRIPRQVYR